MDHAGVDQRGLPDGFDGLKEAGELVAAHDEHITHAPIGQFGTHPSPELRALGGLDPDTQDVFDAVGIDPDP